MRTPSPTTRVPFVAFLLLGSALGQAPERPEADMRGLVLREEGALDGYTLIAPLTSKDLLLLDMQGEVAHRWELPTQTESAILLDDGHLLRWAIAPEEDHPRFQGPGVGGGIVEELDWDGSVLWRYVLVDDERLSHHDIALLPNGNVLLLVWEHHTREEAIAAGRDPAQVGEPGMWPDAVLEVKPTPPEGGEIVWAWRAWDHLVQDFDPSKANYGAVPDAPGRIDLNADHRDRPPLTREELEAQRKLAAEMAALGYGGSSDEEDGEDDGGGSVLRGSSPDWLHTNGIDYLPEHDLIVLSTPKLNELWVIDHSTTTEQAAGSSGGRWGHGGELLWRWGNPRNYGAGGETDQQLSFQHDPTWLPATESGALRLLVFNNGRVRVGESESYSSADELVLPFDPERGFQREPGRPFGPEGPAWTYSEPGTLFSSFISGAQRLPNGNTLICSGAQGRVLEVTREGRLVWDLRSPYTGDIEHGIPANSLYRAVRIPADHPGLRDLER